MKTVNLNVSLKVSEFRHQLPKIAFQRRVFRKIQSPLALRAGQFPGGLNDFMALRYEDLCPNVEGVVNQLAGFLGVSPEGFDLNSGRESSHILGHNSRLTSLSSIDEKKEWQNLLNEAELALFQAVGANHNLLYSYEV